MVVKLIRISRKTLPLFMIGIILISTLIPYSCTFSKKNLINYIQLSQVWELSDEYGGFINSQKENSSIKSTAEAILSLIELNVENQTIYEGAISYITGREQIGGGFAVDSKTSISSLRATYWAITALNGINNLDWISIDSINWIGQRQLLNKSEQWNYGAFENKINSNFVNMEYTYYGILGLSQLNKIYLINSTATLLWVKSRQLVDGGFESLAGFGISDLTSTFYGISILYTLNGWNLINKTSLITYLEKCQNLNTLDSTNYGGFGNAPNSSSGMGTFYAISTLHLLNAIENINITIVRSYVEKLQLNSGAFTIAQGIDQPTITYSYMALMTLSILSLYETVESSIIFYIFIIVVAIVSFFFINYYFKKKKIRKNKLTIRVKVK